MNYVVVGGSVAGLSAIRSIRRRDPEGCVTVVDEDPHPAYSRVLLTDYICGRASEADMVLADEQFFRNHGVTALLGVRAEEVDPDARRLHLADGRVVRYDALLIATGARPVLPRGALRSGVTGLRTREDADRIRRAALAGQHVVIAGGGPVGVKLACALRQLGLVPTLVAASSHLLSRVVDREASLMVERHLVSRGVRVRCGVEVGGWSGGAQGLEEVLLTDGSTLPCALLVWCKGVEPRTELVTGRVAVRRGIQVDRGMRTSVPGVYAAGDVAECTDIWGEGTMVSAIWAHAAAQGRVAGANMAGGRETFSGVLPRNAMDVLGLPIVSLGRVDAPAADGWSVITRRSHGSYLKLVVRGDDLVGALLVGCPRLAGPLQAAIRKGGRVWEQLL